MTRRWRHPAALAMLAANFVPLAGVLFFAWNLFEIMLLFWLDNVAIGLYMTARFQLTYRTWPVGIGYGPLKWQKRRANGLVFAYFFFTLMHGLFLILIFGSFELRKQAHASSDHLELLAETLLKPQFAVAVLALIAGRGVDLYDALRSPGKAKRETEFVRVVVLHVGLIGGGFLIVWLGTPVGALALLVLLKSASDIFAHAYYRR